MTLAILTTNAMVSDEMINKDDNRMKTFMYFFGAVDYVCQNNEIDQLQTTAILSAFLMNTFNLSGEETGTLLKVLMDNTMTGSYVEYMDIGGNAVHSWANGNSTAPMKLSDILNRKV